MKALSFFLPLLAGQKGRLTLALLLSLITLFAGIALLGLSGWFLTAAAISTAGAAFNLFVPSAGVRGLSFVRILSRYGEKIAGHDATLHLLADIRKWLFGKLFPLLPLNDRKLGRADLVSRLVADVDALDTLFLLALGPMLATMAVGLFMSLGLYAVLPQAALIYGGSFFAAAMLVPVGLIVLTRKAGANAVAASADLRRAVLDGLDGHADLVIFAEEGRAHDDVAEAAARLGREKGRVGRMAALASGLVQTLGGFALVGTLIALLPLHAAGTLDGPLMAGLLLAVLASFEAVTPLVRSAGRLAAAAAAAERIKVLVETTPAVHEAEEPVALSHGTLAFKGVTLSRNGRVVLDRISFAIEPGECIAIVGPSGAGKSTLAQLMVRLIDPDAGRITLDGVEIMGAELNDLRNHIRLMTQDAPVFLDTIRNNLRIGRPGASDGVLWSVLAQVHLKSFVASLPDGLDTVVGEAGASLSAGQARRLCLARTLLSPAPIVVLDEPTSGLDRKTEETFLADLRQIAGGRTMVVITHAALPAGFDRVLEVRAGRISPRLQTA